MAAKFIKKEERKKKSEKKKSEQWKKIGVLVFVGKRKDDEEGKTIKIGN